MTMEALGQKMPRLLKIQPEGGKNGKERLKHSGLPWGKT